MLLLPKRTDLRRGNMDKGINKPICIKALINQALLYYLQLRTMSQNRMSNCKMQVLINTWSPPSVFVEIIKQIVCPDVEDALIYGITKRVTRTDQSYIYLVLIPMKQALIKHVV